MEAHREEFRIRVMCWVLGVSRSGYYAWRTRPDSTRKKADQALLQQIRVVHGLSRGTYGAPRVQADLKAEGIVCGRHRVASLMRHAHIRAKAARRFKATTQSRHRLPVAPNLLERRFAVGTVNRVWVADLTYIFTHEGWLYLAVIMDLGSRLIVGWAMDRRMTTELAVTALRMALARRQPGAGLIHHSDRGSQYASDAYQALLGQYAILSSMSRKGDCYDNAVGESFFRTFKVELVYHCDYQSRQEARQSIFEYLEGFYNRRRRHSSLGYLSPVAFEMRKTA